jgi:hypothetical protein
MPPSALSAIARQISRNRGRFSLARLAADADADHLGGRLVIHAQRSQNVAGRSEPDEQALPADTAMPMRCRSGSAAPRRDARHAIGADGRNAFRRPPPRRSPPASTIPARAASAAALPFPASRPLQRGGHAEHAGQVLGAATIAPLLPAAGLQQAHIAHQQRAHADGPPNLCAESRSCRHRANQACPRSARNRPATARPPRARLGQGPRRGWITPVSLLTCWTATKPMRATVSTSTRPCLDHR